VVKLFFLALVFKDQGLPRQGIKSAVSGILKPLWPFITRVYLDRGLRVPWVVLLVLITPYYPGVPRQGVRVPW
jgi:hypothetical protein